MQTLSFFLLSVHLYLGQEDSETSSRIENMEKMLKEISSLVQDSYIFKIYTEINGLQELIGNINSEIGALEQISNSQMEDNSPFNIKEAEFVIKTSDKIIEKLAVLDTKLINVNDKELLDKIEEYVLKMDAYDNHLRKTGKKIKEKIEKFKDHIKDEHRHYWLVALCGVIMIVIVISWRKLVT